MSDSDYDTSESEDDRDFVMMRGVKHIRPVIPFMSKERFSRHFEWRLESKTDETNVARARCVISRCYDVYVQTHGIVSAICQEFSYDGREVWYTRFVDLMRVVSDHTSLVFTNGRMYPGWWDACGNTWQRDAIESILALSEGCFHLNPEKPTELEDEGQWLYYYIQEPPWAAFAFKYTEEEFNDLWEKLMTSQSK